MEFKEVDLKSYLFYFFVIIRYFLNKKLKIIKK